MEQNAERSSSLVIFTLLMHHRVEVSGSSTIDRSDSKTVVLRHLVATDCISRYNQLQYVRDSCGQRENECGGVGE